MKRDVSKVRRKLADLHLPDVLAACEDPDDILIRDRIVIEAYQGNPFATSEHVLAQTVGIVGNRIIGGVGSMPFQLVADGCVYETAASPDIYVNPEFRSTGFALELIDDEWNTSKDKIEVDFYVSPQARKVFGLMGGAVFDIAQFAVVRKSALFFSKRLPRLASGIGCLALDFIFAVHRVFLRCLVGVKAFGCQLVEADDDISVQEFCKLVAENPARFRNHVTPEMLHWLREHDFKSATVAEKHLWRFVRKGKTLGFVYTRYSDNGQRGRALDWEMTPGNEPKTALMLLFTALRLVRGRSAAVISLSNADQSTVRKLKRWLPRLPMQAATVGVGTGSPLAKHEGWDNPKNWRIRPLMGDSALY